MREVRYALRSLLQTPRVTCVSVTVAEPEIYGSIAATSYSAATLVVKARLPPESLIAPVRAAVRDVNDDQTVFDIRTMEDVVAMAYADVDLALRLAGFSAVLAILLSMAGVFAVVSANVSARRKEFGIRLALGADPRRLLRTVATQAGVLVGIGAAAGIVGALALTRFLRSPLTTSVPRTRRRSQPRRWRSRSSPPLPPPRRRGAP